jgi:hypothetical protein
MGDESGCDLLGRQDQAAGRVQDKVERDVRRGHLDDADDRLGVVDVDEPAEGDAEEGEAPTAVDEGQGSRAVPLLQGLQRLGPLVGQQPLLHRRLEAGDDEEEIQMRSKGFTSPTPEG